MKLRNLFLLLALISFSIQLSSQNKKAPQNIKKKFYYSFENVTSESQIEKLKNEVLTLKGVTEVKSEYKSGKAMGQIIVVVIEKEKIHEGDFQFDIGSLKNAIIQSKLTPMELIEEDTIIAN